MQNGLRIPVGVTAISDMMELKPSEVKYWNRFNDVRQLLNDYNLGALEKETLILRLHEISVKCVYDKNHHYCTGIDNLISSIRLSY